MSSPASQSPPIPNYRVFPDYGAVTGVWNQIGVSPYVISYDDLRQMGAKPTTIAMLEAMQLLFEIEPSSGRLPEFVDQYMNHLGKKIVARLNHEITQATFTLYEA